VRVLLANRRVAGLSLAKDASAPGKNFQEFYMLMIKSAIIDLVNWISKMIGFRVSGKMPS
jgi:hypothetical protein